MGEIITPPLSGQVKLPEQQKGGLLILAPTGGKLSWRQVCGRQLYGCLASTPLQALDKSRGWPGRGTLEAGQNIVLQRFQAVLQTIWWRREAAIT